MLSFRRKPSRWLAAILAVAHSVAAALVWLLPLTAVLTGVITILVIVSLFHYLRQDALLTANRAIVAFTLTEEKQCILSTRSGETIVCDFLSSTFVSPYLTVLNLQPEGRFFAHSVVILADGIDADAFRQLRVWLRWKWMEHK